MKIIDRLLTKAFIMPFIGAIGMTISILVLQQIWVYIDDMANKGASALLLLEMVFYMSVSFVPMALPMAVLLASLMVMGNFAESYELASLKSAGISLWRAMMPLLAIAVGVGIFSVFCSDKLIPITNLQSKSRLYDIRNQKPTLSLEEGVFNDDFQGFSIRIGTKAEDGTSIADVLMYDQSQVSNGKYSMVKAKDGEMYNTSDEKYFVMRLEDGHQFSEMKSSSVKDGRKSYPFMRTSFKKWTKVFDLSEFEMDRTDSELFETHYSMLGIKKLQTAIDSIDMKTHRRRESLISDVNRSFHHRKEQEVAKDKKKHEKKVKEIKDSFIQELQIAQDTHALTRINTRYEQDSSKMNNPKFKLTEKDLEGRIPLDSLKARQAKQAKNSTKIRQEYSRKSVIEQEIDSSGLTAHSSLLSTFPEKNRKQLLNKAKSFTRGVQGSVSSVKRALKRIEDSRIDHRYTLHQKFSLAFACVLFLFVGAPMGAIVRKGGFGFPVIIAIVLFVFFIMSGIFFRKTAEAGSVDAALAAWMPCFLLLPFGVFLTYLAIMDSKILNLDRYIAFFKRILTFFKLLKAD